MTQGPQDEKIIAYDLKSPEDGRPMSRKRFYDEQIDLSKNSNNPTKAVAVINVLIFDTNGEIFIQKRSGQKRHNPRLLDKATGGHVKFGDTPDYTVMVETVQELQVPSIVVKNEADFKKTFKLLQEYLNAIAIVKPIDNKIMMLERMISGEPVVIPSRVHLYFGVYNGAVKTVDREAKGILLYSVEDLKEEMRTTPSFFTYDLHLLFRDYAKEIDQFVNYIKSSDA